MLGAILSVAELLGVTAPARNLGPSILGPSYCDSLDIINLSPRSGAYFLSTTISLVLTTTVPLIILQVPRVLIGGFSPNFFLFLISDKVSYLLLVLAVTDVAVTGDT